MAAIKFPFIECRLDLIFPLLSILVWGFNIESVLLRYLLIVAPWAISILDLLALGKADRGIIRRPGRGGGQRRGLTQAIIHLSVGVRPNEYERRGGEVEDW